MDEIGNEVFTSLAKEVDDDFIEVERDRARIKVGKLFRVLREDIGERDETVMEQNSDVLNVVNIVRILEGLSN